MEGYEPSNKIIVDGQVVWRIYKDGTVQHCSDPRFDFEKMLPETDETKRYFREMVGDVCRKKRYRKKNE
jgi:hypothetical protein